MANMRLVCEGLHFQVHYTTAPLRKGTFPVSNISVAEWGLRVLLLLFDPGRWYPILGYCVLGIWAGGWLAAEDG